MNTWVVWTFNPGGWPKIQTKEVQAADIPGTINMACVDSNALRRDPEGRGHDGPSGAAVSAAGRLLVGIVQDLIDTCTPLLTEFAGYLQVPVVQPQDPQTTDIWWNSACTKPTGRPVGVAWNPALLNVEIHFPAAVVRVLSVQLQHPETRIKVFKWVESLKEMQP